MDEFEFVQREKRDRIVFVTINRPESLNALHPPASREMSRIWDEFEADDDAWVAIVTGSGERAFSAGMDLRWRAAANASGESQTSSAAPAKGGFGGLTNPEERQVWKPIIAAVNGYALGGGCELALACDIIVAADTARFGLPEPTRGILAGAGGMHRLPRALPVKIAMGYMLTGKHMTAQEAAGWGLVNEVVPASELMATAERWAREIMECAPLSVRATKQAALLGLDMPLGQAMNTRFPEQEKALSSQDAVEGPKAFAEKRKPVWQGR
ncbi:MAG: enoyl-CoA hydratase-related protein [Dehalococcoidia bacterium]